MKTIHSPIGKPARKSYSLFPAIDKAGKGFEYIEALLKASFQDGINIGDDNFLEELVIDLGLDWTMISKDLNSKHWKKYSMIMLRICTQEIAGVFQVLKLPMKMALIHFTFGVRIEFGY